MLNGSKEKRKKVFSDETIIWHVIGIINHSKADPLVLTSVCFLVHQLLKLDDITKEDGPSFDKLMSQIKDVKNLVDLLGKTKNDKFEQVMKAVQKYNGQKKVLVEVEGSKSFVNLDDKTVLDLFMQIIRLINHFSLLKIKLEKELKKLEANERESKVIKDRISKIESHI